jgi:hypothetical protein
VAGGFGGQISSSGSPPGVCSGLKPRLVEGGLQHQQSVTAVGASESEKALPSDGLSGAMV